MSFCLGLAWALVFLAGVRFLLVPVEGINAQAIELRVNDSEGGKNPPPDLLGNIAEDPLSVGAEWGWQRRQGFRRSTPAGQKTIPKTEAEKKILAVLDDIYQSQGRGGMIVPEQDGKMLRILAEAVDAKRVVELGTSVGCSGLWFCMALKNTDGELVTFEIDERVAKIARLNFKRAEVADLATVVIGDAHEKVTELNDPIDVLFIDADKEGYLDYFEKLNSLVRPGGLILAHNVGMGDRGMRGFTEAITTSADFETAFFQLGAGLSITLKKKAQKEQPQEELKYIREPDVIYVPTPQEVVDKMLELAQVKKSDLVYDLGCGDGRIVVTAAKKYGCRAVGYDINPVRVREARENVRKNNVGHLVTIEQKDIFTLDLSQANVITLYLLPTLNVKLIPQLEKLKPGSRIVSHDFNMEGVKPDKVVQIPEEGYAEHTIYLWTTPLKKIKDTKTTLIAAERK